jgi:hypothetical protein
MTKMSTSRLTRRSFGLLAGGLTLAACSSEAFSTASRAGAGLLKPLRDAPGTVSMFPSPGSRTASRATAIALRGGGLADSARLGDIAVVGTSSGVHSGRLVRHSDGDGVSFVPATGFSPGETVTVTSSIAVRGRDTAGKSRFVVAQPAIETTPPSTTAAVTPKASVTSFISDPDVKAPTMSITVNKSPAGLILLAAKGGGVAGQLMIVRSDGSLVWSRTIPSNMSANDLKLQNWRGDSVLTWWQGEEHPHGYGSGEHHIIDAGYGAVATVSAANGYSADLHDFQLTDRGTALMTAYALVRWDLRPYGGSANGIALDSIVQEVDISTGVALFEWHALDHVSPSASYVGVTTDTTTAWDFFHVNSIHDGPSDTLLVSARHTSALTSLDRITGDVIWTLGGKESDFTASGKVSFFFQHDARWQSNGTITLFDDGGGPPRQAPSSRGLRLKLDMTRRTVSVVKAYAPKTAVVANSQGNTTPLADGHVFVGWGDQPQATEFDASGGVVWNALFPTGVSSYRAFRVGWTGTPKTMPRTALVALSGKRTVYASWNGDTQTATWRLIGVSNGSFPRVLTSITGGAFEVALTVPPGSDQLRVQALDAAGGVLATVAAA